MSDERRFFGIYIAIGCKFSSNIPAYGEKSQAPFQVLFALDTRSFRSLWTVTCHSMAIVTGIWRATHVTVVLSSESLYQFRTVIRTRPIDSTDSVRTFPLPLFTPRRSQLPAPFPSIHHPLTVSLHTISSLCLRPTLLLINKRQRLNQETNHARSNNMPGITWDGKPQ